MKRNKKIWIGILLVSIFAVSGCSKNMGDAVAETNKELENDSVSEFEPNLISMTTYASGICQNWIPETIDDTRILDDIQILKWIVPRGGIGVEEPAGEQSASDNNFLLESNKIFEEYSSQMEEDLYFAIQDVDNEELWRITKIPGYGSWMEKEIELFYRLHMGF